MDQKMIAGILITCSLLLLGFIRKSSHKVLVIQCIWFWILFGFNNGGVDYEGNLSIFLSSENFSRIVIANFLQSLTGYLALSVGLDYVGYNAIMGLICVAIFYHVIKNTSKTPALSMSLFYIYLMGDSVIQKRFFIAMCFTLLAFYYWINKKYVKFYFACFIAVGFHAAMLPYLLFPIVIFISRSKKTAIAVFLFAEILGYKALKHIVLSTSFAGKFVEYTSAQSYSSLVVGICFLLLQLMYLYMIMRIWVLWKNHSDYKMLSIVFLNQSSVLFTPLLLFGATWLRYFRVFQILNFSFIGNRMRECTDRRLISYWYTLGYIFLLLISEFIITLASGIGISGKLETVFHYNLVLQRLIK